MRGPSACMKAPAAPGSSAVIGEPWETKRAGMRFGSMTGLDAASAREAQGGLNAAFSAAAPGVAQSAP